MDEITRTQRSKALSMWLRHKPERAGLRLSAEGWVAIDEALSAFERLGTPMTRAEFDNLVRLDLKGRFEVDRNRVRARYGHSLELEAQPHPGMPPAALFHGTAHRFLARILEGGLQPIKRQFVHLSPDRKTAREVGRRRDQEPAIIAVDAHAAHEAGIKFYPRGKGIWMSDPIPPAFLRVLEEMDAAAPSSRSTGSPIRSVRASAPGIPRRRRPKGGFAKRER
jgi:putative RNA 2'-phosphotransferase